MGAPRDRVTGPAPFIPSIYLNYFHRPEPFGQPLGVENMSLFDYTPMDLSSYFDIDPDSIASCQESDQCGQSVHLPRKIRHQVRYLEPPSNGLE